jgi:hypothetical protein
MALSTRRKLQHAFLRVSIATQRLFRQVFAGTLRLYSPLEETYPAAGTQPLTADPASKRRWRRRHS